MPRVITVVGARPQFVKAAMLSKALERMGITEEIIHTGQHFDDKMSDIFFREMQIPKPAFNLGIGGLSQGAMTGRMIEEIEKILVQRKPDAVIVYGDTNSTMAGALAAVKLGIPIGHVEAGMRSFNRKMPEEINRVVTDHLASFHFLTHEGPAKHLRAEGITAGLHIVGDLMYDSILHFQKQAEKKSLRLPLEIQNKKYALLTLHRRENLEDPLRLASICRGLSAVAKEIPIVFPVHPHTRKKIEEFGLTNELKSLRTIDPTGYLEMIDLEKHSALILTDSGGVQKEAFFCKVPCVTLRDETEWVETVEQGWNILVGADDSKLAATAKNFLNHPPKTEPNDVFGDGKAGEKIAEILSTAFKPDKSFA